MSKDGWRYGCEKQQDGDYALVEVFPDPIGWTGPVTISAGSPEELAKWLEQAAKDIRKYGAIGEKSYAKTI